MKTVVTAGAEIGLMRSLQPPPIGALPSLNGIRVLVMGLGRQGGGVAVTRWLATQGARVLVSDSADQETLAGSVAALSDLDVSFRLGGHCLHDLDNIDLVVVNPAVAKRTSDFFRDILRRGIDWTTEINLFCERCPAGIIGVTGSYGKSTTCAMLAESLSACLARIDARARIYLGGNIGRSLLPLLPEMRPTDVVVLELSNAQLEDIPRISRVPEFAVITNLHAHHLNRYASAQDYFQAKLNILGNGRCDQSVFLGEICPEAQPLLERAVREYKPRLKYVALADPPIELGVSGEHNQSAARLALAVCEVLGLDSTAGRSALGRFAGLPHRMQHVREVGGVTYINDSKSTSPATTLAAIRAMDKPIVAIIGGQFSDEMSSDWVRQVVGGCKLVISVGIAPSAFAEAKQSGKLEPRSTNGVVAVSGLEDAVRCARSHAIPGDVVLFSPGAPSFDRYVNFVERGRHFMECVGRL